MRLVLLAGRPDSGKEFTGEDTQRGKVDDSLAEVEVEERVDTNSKK